jgi:hypothetical protein
MSDQPGVDGHNRAAGFCPCFPVTDMRAALAHYEQLGFEVMRYEDGQSGPGPGSARPSFTCT